MGRGSAREVGALFGAAMQDQSTTPAPGSSNVEHTPSPFYLSDPRVASAQWMHSTTPPDPSVQVGQAAQQVSGGATGSPRQTTGSPQQTTGVPSIRSLLG